MIRWWWQTVRCVGRCVCVLGGVQLVVADTVCSGATSVTVKSDQVGKQAWEVTASAQTVSDVTSLLPGWSTCLILSQLPPPLKPLSPPSHLKTTKPGRRPCPQSQSAHLNRLYSDASSIVCHHQLNPPTHTAPPPNKPTAIPAWRTPLLPKPVSLLI